MNLDFSYSFATPHRLTVCLPGKGNKTLLDVEPGRLTMLWSYENLVDLPLNTFKTPHVDWRIRVEPMVDGKTMETCRWERPKSGIPELLYSCRKAGVACELDVVGTAEAALVRVTVVNDSRQKRRVEIHCRQKGGYVLSNPAWYDGTNPDTLLATQYERADRVLIVALGANAYPVDKTSVTLAWDIEPGQTRVGWIIRPHKAYEADLPKLRATDWEAAFAAGRAAWETLLGRSADLLIPDADVKKAYRACLSDLFVMREPLPDGYVGVLPGTEVYRATNPFEPALTAILLDQVGLHAEAADGLRVHLDAQEADGCWAERSGWVHHMWGASGFKAWAAMEHYKLTGDRAYLTKVYPRMLASSRWQESQRARTRVLEDGQRPVTYGLMPRGMGDAGLMNGDDLCGVFYPHNFLTIFADQLAIEAATILGKNEDLSELRRIHDVALADLRASLEKGVISEEDYRWIPGTPNKTSGSVWGALMALYPCGILAPDDPLVLGSFRHIERNISPGGHPVGTGWMLDGCWVAISLDNVAEAHLARGDGDAASKYLYPTLNHATPLITWCEERGVEPGTTKTSGDRQHLWTPVAVCRYLRDAFVMEREGGLDLALGVPREWLASGKPLGVRGAPTHFGNMTYEMRYDEGRKQITGTIELGEKDVPRVALHIRLPGQRRIQKVNAARYTELSADGRTILWRNISGIVRFEATLWPW